MLTNNEKIVLFLTPMWAAHKQDLREELTLMKHARFKKIAKVDTALSYEPDVDANVQDFAKQFSMHPVLLRGSTSVIQKELFKGEKGDIQKRNLSITEDAQPSIM